MPREFSRGNTSICSNSTSTKLAAPFGRRSTAAAGPKRLKSSAAASSAASVGTATTTDLGSAPAVTRRHRQQHSLRG
jgi:hypothetical protein